MLLCSIKLSQIKIPKSYISILNGTGISVQGTEIAIKLDELWSYEFSSWYVCNAINLLSVYRFPICSTCAKLLPFCS